MMCGIYRLEFPDGKFYIGSSYRIERRFADHSQYLKRGKHKNYRLQRAYDEHQKVTETVLLVCRKEDLFFYEQICLDRLKPPLNISKLADRVEMTVELRAKISALLKGRPRWSDAEKAEMSRTRKGRRLSEEHKAKVGAAFRGKLHSEERRSKLLGNQYARGSVRSDGFKANASVKLRGIVRSKETRERMSIAQKKRFAK